MFDLASEAFCCQCMVWQTMQLPPGLGNTLSEFIPGQTSLTRGESYGSANPAENSVAVFATGGQDQFLDMLEKGVPISSQSSSFDASCSDRTQQLKLCTCDMSDVQILR